MSFRFSDREKAEIGFSQERARLAEMTRALTPERGGRRVLIPRLRGLEDSSRYWSVFMTLEHLRIVNEVIADLLPALAAGKPPEGEASTAAVKPAAGAGPEAIPAFDAACARLKATAAGIPDLQTRARYVHPWFGPLDAAGWHFLAWFHMRLHRRQIEAILARAGREPAVMAAKISL